MAYALDPDLEYFLGCGLPPQETAVITAIRQQLENRSILSSPPHITIKRPFRYHFEKPLSEQLEKWAKRQRPFTVDFEKIGSFKHHKYGTVFLAPERAKPFRELEQDLTQSIRFLPLETNYTPHLTIANRLDLNTVDAVKQQVRALKLSLQIEINSLTLFQHHRFEPWQIKNVFKFGTGHQFR
ncbi:MAG TPA: 2'-5' RNA ligase family protein [Vitreimonas sp.]|nr:2'-5' RNA ligase family protein [Vitreimonas sp.]